MTSIPPSDGRQRAFIVDVQPALDGGRYPVKRVLGDRLVVAASFLSDGHEQLGGALLWRREDSNEWSEAPLIKREEDRFEATFELSSVGLWYYTVLAWIDPFLSWQQAMRRRLAAAQEVSVELRQGSLLLYDAANRATGEDERVLRSAGAILESEEAPMAARLAIALDEEVARRAARLTSRPLATRYHQTLAVVVDPPRARFSTWYEFFPRSFGEGGKHGTFRDAEKVLPYVAEMGFDVVYLPPIHPIGRAHRKGKNNAATSTPGEPGSPWAIGATEGGHKAVHPELGGLEAFAHFCERARSLRLDIALDIAFQVSPDHPYVTEHPQWFKHRPDGSIQYAENPPKKYQDVYPFDFECDDWQALWEELKSVFLFWVERGIKIFRVDNPHTKPLSFWEWCIKEVKAKHPEVIFLAEAFTRPNMMYTLARLGFSQSYTYFTWRTSKQELTRYLTELTRTEVAEFYRPNFWPNTPDILPEHLQIGTRATFITRLILAATLSSNYGIYGPSFELMEQTPRPGAEEYIDSEKYELRRWPIHSAESLQHIIRRVNEIRRQHPALQSMEGLSFHKTDHEPLLCYSKQTRDGADMIIVVVNLDPQHTHVGWVELSLPEVMPGQSLQLHDLISDARYLWHSTRGYVQLDPRVMPAHIFHVRRLVRNEHSFEYYL